MSGVGLRRDKAPGQTPLQICITEEPHGREEPSRLWLRSVAECPLLYLPCSRGRICSLSPLPRKTINLSSLESLSGPFWGQGLRPSLPKDPTVAPAPSLPLGAQTAPLSSVEGGFTRVWSCSSPIFFFLFPLLPSSLSCFPPGLSEGRRRGKK